MSNRSKAKGTRFESEVVAYLSDHGFPHAERRALRGNLDCGDVALGIPGIVLELKNCKAMALSEWCNEAAKEAQNDGCSRWAVIHKRRGKGVGESYVTLSLEVFAELLREENQ